MKLFYSPFHTFIHKALVTIHEAGLWDAVEFVPTYPFQNRDGEVQDDKYSIAALNPLDKVPTLALDDGTEGRGVTWPGRDAGERGHVEEVVSVAAFVGALGLGRSRRIPRHGSLPEHVVICRPRGAES